MSPSLLPSRFNAYIHDDDGALLVFNSYSSALLEFRGDAALAVSAALDGTMPARGVLADYLAEQGVLVPESCDELERARLLHERPFGEENRSLSLMLMPHENCNFRCVYCYEEFKKNKMKPEVVEGVVALVRTRAPGLRTFSLGWFGGEPLLALDVVEDVATRVRQICGEHEVSFGSEMTTNGFLLDGKAAARCIGSGITRYQITLDGPAETHNRSRMLVGGGSTFAKVLGNLQHLRDHAQGFYVVIRVNFSPANLPKMPEFITFLGQEFGRDPRFAIRFRPVGKWGGPHDETLVVCDHESGENQEISLMAMAMDAGFTLQTWQGGMFPSGSVCYAANPRHFVIGSDGIVYKCTVAFNDPRNHVGQLQSDGTLTVNPDLLRLWTRSGEETDSDCQTCHFRPACQGNLCPLERLDGAEKRCPTAKTHIGTILPMLALDARRSAAGAP